MCKFFRVGQKLSAIRRQAREIALTPEGNLAYRFADGWVSNGDNGRRNLNDGRSWQSRP